MREKPSPLEEEIPLPPLFGIIPTYRFSPIGEESEEVMNVLADMKSIIEREGLLYSMPKLLKRQARSSLAQTFERAYRSAINYEKWKSAANLALALGLFYLEDKLELKGLSEGVVYFFGVYNALVGFGRAGRSFLAERTIKRYFG
ncbi:hypothetical protein D6817_02355 [Candidatus Pacearchaeota archaeon]|nr:MAG: hypothetical protein D6817_02355 [Candidatus Pacearchaeota archaeon]